MNTLQASLLGQPRTLTDSEGLVQIIDGVSSQDSNGETLFITAHNMHSLALELKNPTFRAAQHSAKIGILDGTPLVWFLSLRGHSLNPKWRITMLDWMPLFLSHANQKKWRVFLLGTTPASIEIARAKLSAKYPSIEFAFHHGHFSVTDANENSRVTSQIKDFAPHCLLVGMGMPRQEIWLNSVKNQHLARAAFPVGGYFDYIAGKTFTPPRWTSRLGLEWLARLLADPRRLYHRYLIEPWPVIFVLLRELFRRQSK